MGLSGTDFASINRLFEQWGLTTADDLLKHNITAEGRPKVEVLKRLYAYVKARQPSPLQRINKVLYILNCYTNQEVLLRVTYRVMRAAAILTPLACFPVHSTAAIAAGIGSQFITHPIYLHRFIKPCGELLFRLFSLQRVSDISERRLISSSATAHGRANRFVNSNLERRLQIIALEAGGSALILQQGLLLFPVPAGTLMQGYLIGQEIGRTLN